MPADPSYGIQREQLFKRLTDPHGDPPPDYCLDLFRLECLHGIPDKWRPLAWKTLLGVYPYYQRKDNKWETSIIEKRNTYYHLVADISPAALRDKTKATKSQETKPQAPQNGDSSLPPRVAGDKCAVVTTSSGSLLTEADEQLLNQIHKDVRRTFRGLRFLQGNTSQAAYSPLNGTIKTSDADKSYINPIDTSYLFNGLSLNEFSTPSPTDTKSEYISPEASEGNPSIASPAPPHWQAIERVLFIYAKLNPGVGGGYVQGMNEVLAPLYYVFSNDANKTQQAHSEADSFLCFSQIISELRDHYINSMDNVRPAKDRSREESSTSLVSNNSETFRVFQNDISARASHNSSNKEFSSTDLFEAAIAAANEADSAEVTSPTTKSKVASGIGDMYAFFFNSKQAQTLSDGTQDDPHKPVKMPSELDFSVIKHGNGIGITMGRLLKRLRKFDNELFLDLQTKGIHPAYYSFRWITCLLTYEFQLPDLIQLWDSIFADISFDIVPENPYSDIGIQIAVATKYPDIGSLESIDESSSSLQTVEESPETNLNTSMEVGIKSNKLKNVRRNNKFNFLLDLCCAMLIVARDKLMASNFEECLSFLQNYTVEDPNIIISKAFEFWVPPISKTKLEQFDEMELSELHRGDSGSQPAPYYQKAIFQGILEEEEDNKGGFLSYLGVGQKPSDRNKLVRAKRLLSAARRVQLRDKIKELGKNHSIITGSALNSNRSSVVSRFSTTSKNISKDTNSNVTSPGEKPTKISTDTSQILKDGWIYAYDCRVKTYKPGTEFATIFRRTDLYQGGYKFPGALVDQKSPISLSGTSYSATVDIFPELEKTDHTSQLSPTLPDDGCIGSPQPLEVIRRSSLDLSEKQSNGSPVSPSLAFNPNQSNKSRVSLSEISTKLTDEFSQIDDDIVDTRKSATMPEKKVASAFFAGDPSMPLFQYILWETSLIKQQQRSRKEALLNAKRRGSEALLVTTSSPTSATAALSPRTPERDTSSAFRQYLRMKTSSIQSGSSQDDAAGPTSASSRSSGFLGYFSGAGQS